MRSRIDDLTVTKNNIIADVYSDAIDVSEYAGFSARAVIDLIGAPTAPTLDIVFQMSLDGENWVDYPAVFTSMVQFTQTAVDATELALMVPLATRYFRFKYDIDAAGGYVSTTKCWNTTIKLNLLRLLY